MRLQKYFKMFKGKNEDGQLGIIRNLLKGKGFHHKVVTAKNGAKTEWFWKEGADHVFAVAINKHGQRLLIIMPSDYAKDRYANKEGEFVKYICIQMHGTNELVAKFKSRRLHQDIFDFCNIPYGNLQIDHICGHPGVYAKKELRPCTNEQNSRNKRSSKVRKGDEFDFKREHDFRDSFWIPFLHYVLGVISYEDMDELRRMELQVQGN